MADVASIASQLNQLKADARENVVMNTTVSDTVSRILGDIEGKTTKLKVNNVWVDKKMDNADIEKQQDIRNSNKIWADDLRADVELVDKETGKTIDRVKNLKVSTIPKITDRMSYSIKGNEYQFTKQARLKPGVYTKRQKNGEISSFFNVDKSVDFDRGYNNNFKINFNPEKKSFTMTYGTKNIPLINALRVIGASEGEIKGNLGKEVYDANDKAYTKNLSKDRTKLYASIFGKQPDKELSDGDINAEIKERLFKTELDAETTKITLGKKYSNVGKGAILDASKKIISINKGEVKGDDRESLIFKEFYGAEDHVREKLVKSADKIKSSTAFKLDKTKSINRALSSQTFDPYTVGTITTSKLSNPPNQTNVMSMLGNDTKFTLMGEGGVGSTNALTNEMRTLSNSEVGFVDPLHTPEGGGIGISVHTAMDTVKVGKELYSRVATPDGRFTMASPMDMYDKKVAFPGEFENSEKGKKAKARNKKVRVTYKGELMEVDPSEVDMILPNAKGMFNYAANSIPFLGSLQGNRGLTASKMQEQALSLKDRDKPLFKVVDEKGRSISESLAGVVALPKSKVSGTVVKVGKKEIIVKGDDGKNHTTKLYNDYSLNSEAYLNNEAVVSKGDKIEKGDILADNNFTRDGQIALGSNLRVAYMPFKGYNYEDSAIMAESAAKKLTSNHMYDFKAKRSSKGVFSKDKFKAYYPEELDATKAEKLDDDGIIRVGQKVDEGDVLIAHMERKMPTADDLAVGRLDKQLRRDMADNSLKWDKHNKGIVTSVKKHGNSVVVNVKTEEQLKVADKISGIHGNKHIISRIVPDSEMPYDPVTGEHIELTMSPIGVSNRMNTSQILETAAGKIAKKTGKQYEIQNFANIDNSRKIMDDLKAAGLSDKETLINPDTGKPFRNKVATGVSHMLKLEHVIDHKFSSRYKAGYDANEQATTGGHDGAKKIGRMEMSAFLARDAHHNLKEIFDIKGQRNDDYWRALETGMPLPPPKKAFVWDKQIAMMKGAGINVEQNGKKFSLKPMTDADVEQLSRGEILKPDQTYRKKDLAPMREGLFDPVKVGGMQGDHYTHFELPEKTLNPITATAAASITNLKKKEVDDIMSGKKFVMKSTGKLKDPGTAGAVSFGPGREEVLKRGDVKEELKSASALAEKTRNKTQLNKLNRKIKTLRALESTGMKPTDYLVKKVLVTPSKYRPMFSMGAEGTVIMSDVNELYQSTAQTSTAMKDLAKELTESGVDADTSNLMLADSRSGIYNDLKAVTGIGKPTSYLHNMKDKKGYISQIDGGKEKQTKEGFFQAKVLERRQDLTGRSTITLDPNLGTDEIGLPEEMATDIFRPKIMSKIISMGYSPLEAQKEVKDESDLFKRARQVVADESLVIANRAPSLHRYNMTAFHPKLVKGKAIEVGANVIANNFGGDYDGDTFQIHTPVGINAMREAEKMLPSGSMLKSGWGSVLNMPGQDIVTGAWLASKGRGGYDSKMKFKDAAELEEAVKQHKLSYLDTAEIGGRKATAGMHAINSTLPDKEKRWDFELNKGNIEGWVKDTNNNINGKAAATLVDKIKDVGNSSVTEFGFTLGVSDTLVDQDIKKTMMADYNKASKKDRLKALGEAKAKGDKLIQAKHGDKTMLGIGMTSGGSKGMGNTSSITYMSGYVTDPDENVVDIPITKGFSEGLNTAEYWAGATNARGGNIKKSVTSFLPGWFTKDLAQTMYDVRVESDNPMDTVGVEVDLKNTRNVVNRFLAQDAKDEKGKIIAKRNELVNSDVINKLNKASINKINVQSPLTDPTPGDGFSSYSYGVDYDGNLPNTGDHIGVKAMHTLTEPSLNLAMKAFHSVGTAGGKKKKKSTGTAFDAMDRLYRLSNSLPDRATLAPMDGVVSDIRKNAVGGWDMEIQSGDKKTSVYVDEDRDIKFAKGKQVKKGQEMTDGTASPHDVLKYRGMKETQKYLVDKIDDLNGGKLDRREIETTVRGLTNTTRIMKPGSNSMYTAGDAAPLTTVEFYNNNRKREDSIDKVFGARLDQDYGKFLKGTKVDTEVAEYLSLEGHKRVKVKSDKIEHEPFLVPLGIAGKQNTKYNWINRMAGSRIRDTLDLGATQNWEANVGGLTDNPIGSYVTGLHDY